MSQSTDSIIQQLSHRPEHILEGVISADPAFCRPKSTPIRRKAMSSLGRFETIPLELLHECLGHLDVLSLQRLSRVCLHGKRVVESLLQLSTPMEATRDTLVILNRAQVLGLHSVNALCAALSSDTCISCDAYGPFLHLLSAQRCCFLCVMANQSLWMVSVPTSKLCFGLKEKQLRKLPVMWSIPGKYRVPRSRSRLQSIRLTTIKAAKELALKKCGSLEAFEKACPFHPDDFPPFKVDLWMWYRNAPLHAYVPDACVVDDGETRPKDPYAGMGAVHFPSISAGQVEQGLWCRGCQAAFEKYFEDDMDDDTLARLVPRGCDPERYLHRAQYRAFSKSGFVEHAKLFHSDAVGVP